uniref:Eukaryotic translation initiation factor 3 subunit A putative n=1 Tax=Albugo laibachii Nc14 TaxID=890382 RepID=F0WGH2_9STRA|nr:eukaryotic translation initiation factor 3 subunit A putative [Albugo laibachii Nc14]|eukprot:CCA20335.1 eukaryotic translation initiation factor 3 subunit A putative [Albugo laibachii Nc14]
MANLLHRPENALKRAKELLTIPNIDAGVLLRTKKSALETLHDALSAKYQRTWLPAHEELIILYLDICVELQLERVAKGGLHQYRNLSIQQNPASLEKVILHLIAQTDRKLSQARDESNERVIQIAAKVDLEGIQSPESAMLLTTSFDNVSERSDRELVVPWLRFMWEIFRHVLDTLKNNSKLEQLYKTVALKAFDFCVTYARKIEFRRLCEILRHHLVNLQKHIAAPTDQSTRQLRAWDGFTSSSVENLLDIRYHQVGVAIKLELYSEAFRTVDDINVIMGLIDELPNEELILEYYEKLADIFLVSNNFLFHAFALHKFFMLKSESIEQKDGSLLPPFGEVEQQELATRVSLAALSIPFIDFENTGTAVLDDDNSGGITLHNAVGMNGSVAIREKNARMASLMAFVSIPTREDLIDAIESSGIIRKALPNVQALYRHLEMEEIDPLQIVQQVKVFLDKLRSTQGTLGGYIASIEKLLVRRVLFQLTRVYSTVTIDHLKSIFHGLDVTYEEIEQLIVRSRSLSNVSQSSGLNVSSTYGNAQHYDSKSSSTGNPISAMPKIKIRIDHIQNCVRFTDAIELEANPTQLCALGERLARALNRLRSDQKRAGVRSKVFSEARSRLSETRQAMLSRGDLIEQKKEEFELLQQEKQKLVEKKREEYENVRQILEKARIVKETLRREMEKKQKIKEEIALKETKQALNQLGRNDLDKIDLENIDREKIDKLMKEAKIKAQRAKEGAQRKIRESARRLDYIIRATREVEQPVLHQQFIQAKEDANINYARTTEEKLRNAREEYENGLKEKERLHPAQETCAEFETAHVHRRAEAFKLIAEEQRKAALLAKVQKRVANAKARYEDEKAQAQELLEQQKAKELARQKELELENEEKAREEAKRAEMQQLEDQRKRAEEQRIEEQQKREEEQRMEEQSKRDAEMKSDRQSTRSFAEESQGRWSQTRTKSSREPTEKAWERQGPSSSAAWSGSRRNDRDRDSQRPDRSQEDSRDRGLYRRPGDREGSRPDRGLDDQDRERIFRRPAERKQDVPDREQAWRGGDRVSSKIPVRDPPVDRAGWRKDRVGSGTTQREGQREGADAEEMNSTREDQNAHQPPRKREQQSSTRDRVSAPNSKWR